MTRAISALLNRAADAALQNDGVVPVDIMMELGAEGYDADCIDMDVERLIASRGQ